MTGHNREPWYKNINTTEEDFPFKHLYFRKSKISVKYKLVGTLKNSAKYDFHGEKKCN